MSKRSSPSAERNKAPLLEVLRRVLPSAGTLLEVGSGTGQHASYFAEHLPGLIFQPSDLDSENITSIRAWARDAALANLRPPIELDVTAEDWGVGRVDAIFSANMIHIAPWACARGLFAGVARHLADAGVFVLYGPFRIDGRHTAASNAAFDADLRARDPSFGVRDLEAVQDLARAGALRLVERIEMPANNQCLVFARGAAAPLDAESRRSSTR
jgi:cyclopropane fatty-acyl-phospholipid synthase-like methyltransferase